MSQHEPLKRTQERIAAEKERRLKITREIAKKRELLRSAKAQEGNDG